MTEYLIVPAVSVQKDTETFGVGVNAFGRIKEVAQIKFLSSNLNHVSISENMFLDFNEGRENIDNWFGVEVDGVWEIKNIIQDETPINISFSDIAELKETDIEAYSTLTVRYGRKDGGVDFSFNSSTNRKIECTNDVFSVFISQKGNEDATLNSFSINVKDAIDHEVHFETSILGEFPNIIMPIPNCNVSFKIVDRITKILKRRSKHQNSLVRVDDIIYEPGLLVTTKKNTISFSLIGDGGVVWENDNQEIMWIIAKNNDPDLIIGSGFISVNDLHLTEKMTITINCKIPTNSIVLLTPYFVNTGKIFVQTRHQ